jgi:hypothetical protein
MQTRGTCASFSATRNQITTWPTHCVRGTKSLCLAEGIERAGDAGLSTVTGPAHRRSTAFCPSAPRDYPVGGSQSHNAPPPMPDWSGRVPLPVMTRSLGRANPIPPHTRTHGSTVLARTCSRGSAIRQTTCRGAMSMHPGLSVGGSHGRTWGIATCGPAYRDHPGGGSRAPIGVTGSPPWDNPRPYWTDLDPPRGGSRSPT